MSHKIETLMSHKSDQMKKHGFAPQNNRNLAPQIRQVFMDCVLSCKRKKLLSHKTDGSFWITVC